MVLSYSLGTSESLGKKESMLLLKTLIIIQNTVSKEIFMKKIFFLFSIIIFTLINFDGGEHSVSAKTDDEDIAEQQSLIMTKFEAELSKMNINLEEINTIGDFYFKDGNMVLQLDSSNRNQKGIEKLKKIANNLYSESTELNSKFNIKFRMEEVSHSYDELVSIQNDVIEWAKSNYLVDYITYINTERNKVYFVTSEISEENKNKLMDNFGDSVGVEIDEKVKENFKNEPEASKARKTDWNSQGGGIGIRVYTTATKYYMCSTAGVAQKGDKLWVMSAGHCNNHGDTLLQWDSRLGSTHLDATASDYDFLLIKVANSPIKRYATNGLYNDKGDSSSGYDGSLDGDFVEKVGLKVCKVGITTGRTCGEISRIGIRESWGTGLLKTEVRNDGSLLSKGGDSGGAWFTQSKPYRLVGIHQGGNKNLADEGSSVSYFTPWHKVRDKYGLTLYTSSSKTPMN